MSDLRRQRDAATRRAERAEHERDLLRATRGWFDIEYLETIQVLVHLAASGRKLPDDLGAPITLNNARSRIPQHDAWAYDQLRKQRTDQRQEAAELKAKIRARYNSGHPEEAQERPQPVQAYTTPQTA